MKLTYIGDDFALISAVSFVNQLATSAVFWEDIRGRGGFDHTVYSGDQIARLMQDHAETVSVELYTPPFLRHRHTNAYTTPGRPNAIFYNRKKLHRSVGDMVNTLVHEFVHVVDHAEAGAPDAGFTHDGQYESGNANAAPYWIGDLAQRHFDRSSPG